MFNVYCAWLLMDSFKVMKNLASGFALIAALIAPNIAYAHCQIPCGIYNDNARVKSMLEDAETVHKSVVLINQLSGESGAQSQNQLTRWISNKESHSQAIISTISDYFLTQRVKSSQDDYVERLKKHHAVIVASMKAKQNSDTQHADELKEAIVELIQYYPEHRH